MTFTIHSRSNQMTLDEVIARLATHAAVEGVVIIGSASQAQVNPASDYDLIVLLAETPAPLHVALTYVDNRLTDVIYLTVETLDRLMNSTQSFDADTMDGKFIRWLQTGQIAFDRSGRLAHARAQFSAADRVTSPGWSARYSAWFDAHYNVKQTRRMLSSTDPVYLMAVDLRLLFSIYVLWCNYFRVRGLPWPGDKGALRYVAEHDPEYLDVLRACLAETGRERKVALYEQLARLTVAPMGQAWEDGDTAITFEGQDELAPQVIETALRFWEGLIGPAEYPVHI